MLLFTAFVCLVLGLGVAGLTAHAQDELTLEGPLYAAELTAEVPDALGAVDETPVVEPERPGVGRDAPGWRPGDDVHHDEHGAGWVWGAGRGVVTVRFEGPLTGPGPVRSLRHDDPQLHPADPPDWLGAPQ